MYINKHNKVIFNFTNTKYDTRFKKHRFDEAYKRIAITPFELKPNYNTSCVYKSLIGGDVNLDYCTINCRELHKARLSGIALYYFFVILASLEEDTNIVKIALLNVAKELSPGNQACMAVDKLVDSNVLVRTNMKSTYIINHNIAFKGNLNQFIKDYHRIYGDAKPMYNEKGRVIIKHL